MKISPLHMAALAVVAVDGLQVAGTRPPFVTTADFIYTGVLDEDGRHWIVKYPLTDQGGTLLEAETAISASLLGELRSGRLSFDVMRPEGYAAYEGRRAVVYPAPLGKMRTFEELNAADARELGRTLGTIHTLDPIVVTSVGLPAYSADEVRDRLMTELEDAADAAPIPAVMRRRWTNMLDDDDMWDFLPVVTHGDIADENFLWSEGVIRSVFGFGEAHVGDPAVDIAPLSSVLPPELYNEFFEAYCHSLRNQVDDHLLERATLMSEFALVRWLMHGVLTNSPEIISDATTMLEQLALDIDADPTTSPGPAWHIDHAEPIEADDSINSFHDAAFNSTDTLNNADIRHDSPDSPDTDDSPDAAATTVTPVMPFKTNTLVSSTTSASVHDSTVPTALTADLSLTADAAYDPSEESEPWHSDDLHK